MKVFRYAALAWAAALLLSVAPPQSGAQDAETEPELVERQYDCSGMTGDELTRAPKNGGIGDVLAPDLIFQNAGYDHNPERWSLRHSGDEARCWGSADEVMADVANVCNTDGSSLQFSGVRGASTRILVRTTPELHRRIAFVVAALREIAKARVSIKVLRLDGKGTPGGVTMTADQAREAQKSAKLVGTMHGGLGERMVLQRLQHRSYLADYDISVATGAVSAYSQVRDLRTGEEIVCGAIMLPGNRIWLQGWHACMKLEEMRTLETNCGRIELPRAAYAYTPVSVVMARGQGAVLDCGEGSRFLLVADCDTPVENKTLPLEGGGSLELFNVAGMLRGYGPEVRWIMTPNVNRVSGDGVSLDQVFLEEPIDGPYNDAAYVAAEWLNNESFADHVRFGHVGPWLAMVSMPPQGDAEAAQEHAESVARARGMLKQFMAPPQAATLRIRAWVVKSSTSLPDGLIEGKPSAKDTGILETSGAPVFERVAGTMVGQTVDFMEITLASHLRDYQTVLAQQASGLDPQTGILVLGKQMRWTARPGDDGKLGFELRGALTVGPSKFEQIPWGDEKKWSIERSLSDLAQMELAGELAVGEAASCVCPAGADDALLVLIMARVK